MSPSKLDKLRSLIERNPQDPFPLYGLAMEHKRLEQDEDAIQTFSDLVERFPDYTAAYYHYGATLIRAGRESEAEAVLQRGMDVAQSNGDSHARDELAMALEDLRD